MASYPQSPVRPSANKSNTNMPNSYVPKTFAEKFAEKRAQILLSRQHHPSASATALTSTSPSQDSEVYDTLENSTTRKVVSATQYPGCVIYMRYHEDPRYPLDMKYPWQPDHLFIDNDILERESAMIKNIFTHIVRRQWQNGEAHYDYGNPSRNRYVRNEVVYFGHLAQSPVFGSNEDKDRWDCLQIGEFNLWRAFKIWVHWLEHGEFTGRVTLQIKKQLLELCKFLMLHNEEKPTFEEAFLEAFRNKGQVESTYPEAKDDPMHKFTPKLPPNSFIRIDGTLSHLQFFPFIHKDFEWESYKSTIYVHFVLGPRDQNQSFGKSENNRVRLSETFLLRNSSILAELIVAARRTLIVADYIYDPAYTDAEARTGMASKRLGQYDKVIYWEMMLQAAQKYYRSKEATELLKLGDGRFGFEGLKTLYTHEANGPVQVMSSESKSTALTVGRLLRLDESPNYDYMKKLEAVQVSKAMSNTPQLQNDPPGRPSMSADPPSEKTKPTRILRTRKVNTVESDATQRLSTDANLSKGDALPVKNGKVEVTSNPIQKASRKAIRAKVWVEKASEPMTKKRPISNTEFVEEETNPAKKVKTAESGGVGQVAAWRTVRLVEKRTCWRDGNNISSSGYLDL